jgi:hypothetical protein
MIEKEKRPKNLKQIKNIGAEAAVEVDVLTQDQNREIIRKVLEGKGVGVGIRIEKDRLILNLDQIQEEVKMNVSIKKIKISMRKEEKLEESQGLILH